jgi:hypothetical protein
MITKILFTALIILAALTFLRHKNSQSRGPELRRQREEERRGVMMVAVALVSLTLAISAGIYYMHWKEAHHIYNVQIINSHNGEQHTYQAYRDDIGPRSFRTTDGRQINLADTERMEVQEEQR